MKILTHKYVIYDGGWQFKWEKMDSFHITTPGRELILWCAILYILCFN